MKQKLIIILTIFTVCLCFAETKIPKLDTYDIIPSATTNSFLAPYVNPAAMAFTGNTGLGYFGNYAKEGENDLKGTNDYKLLFVGENIAYSFHNLDNKKSKHLIASYKKIYRNFYLGTSYKWKNSNFSDGLASLSMLYRPTNYFSTALIAKDMFKGSDAVKFQLGTAFKPLYSTSWAEYLVLTADVNYLTYTEDNEEKNEFLKPTIGLQTQLFNGLQVGGTYQLEDETAFLNFNLNFNNLSLGSFNLLQNTEKKDNDLTNGYGYVFLSDKILNSFTNNYTSNKFYQYNIGKQIVEKKSSIFKIGPFEFVEGKGKTIAEIKKTIEKLKNNPNIKGIVFKNQNVAASFANINAFKNILIDFKKSGKKVYFYYEGISNINYCLAAAVADKIYLNPQGGVDLKGISISNFYVKGLLDTLGIDFYNFRSHKYKTAGNSFSEFAMTDGEREALNTVLDGLYSEMKEMILLGRKDKLAKPVDEIIDNGPYTIAQKALNMGLVDELIYEDELAKKIIGKSKIGGITSKLPGNKVRTNWSDDSKYNIAVIHALGSIHSGKSKNGKTIGSVTTSNQIKAAANNPNIDAIVLRIDSGGGSALASDIIARQVQLCKKPIIASMGGTAASGGYYIAAKADKIVADPATITGSIGVIGMMPNLSRLYSKIKVNWSRVKKGKHSDIFALSRPMAEDEKALIAKSIKHTYNSFIDVVAKGRNLKTEDVHKIAQGRIWTGKQALANGLVDELGSLDKAVDIAVKKLGNHKQANVFNYPKGNMSSIKVILDDDIPFMGLATKLPFGFDILYKQAKKFMDPNKEIILLKMPYDINID